MHELLARIITDAAAMQAEGSIAQGGGVHARDADIDCHGLHMQTVFCHGPRAAAEKAVAPGRPITTDHVDFRILPPQPARQIMQ